MFFKTLFKEQFYKMQNSCFVALFTFLNLNYTGTMQMLRFYQSCKRVALIASV